jgi:hypothetical protein
MKKQRRNRPGRIHGNGPDANGLEAYIYENAAKTGMVENHPAFRREI